MDTVIELIIQRVAPISIYVFGSATSNTHNNSDIDLLIISNYFHGISKFKRTRIIKSVVNSVDPLCWLHSQVENHRPTKRSSPLNLRFLS